MLRTDPLNAEQAIELRKWEEVFDFWKPSGAGQSADILFPPESTKTVDHLLKEFDRLKVETSTMIEDVGLLINETTRRFHVPYNGRISFDQYYSHDDVSLYILGRTKY